MEDRNSMHPKSYKVFRLYKYIFNSCVEVFGKRSPLAEAFIRETYEQEGKDISSLPTYTKGQFIEVLIDGLLEHEKPVEYLLDNLNSERVSELRDILVKNGMEANQFREYIAFRVLPIYRDHIENLAVKRPLGEVVEVAIANLINNCTQVEYQLIKKTFREIVRNEKNKSVEQKDKPDE